MERPSVEKKHKVENPLNFGMANRTAWVWSLDPQGWSPTDIRRIRALGMNCRQVIQIKWIEHRTNDSVLEEMGIRRMLMETVKVHKLRYFSHITRTQNISTHLLQGRIDGRWSRGRQKKRWCNNKSGLVTHWCSVRSLRMTGQWMRMV